MKILVLGTGDPGSKKHAGHDFMFHATPGEHESIPLLSNYELALFHLGDDSADCDCAKVLDYWNSKNELAKVIAFSGSKLRSEQQMRLRELGGVPFISSISTGDDVLQLNWAAIPANSRTNARELVERLIKPDSKLTALYILCQGFLLASLRLTLDGAGYEAIDESDGSEATDKWTPVDPGDAKSIKDDLETMHLDPSALGKMILPSGDGGIAYWSSVCTALPACNDNPCSAQDCDIGKWLLKEFGLLEMENTHILIHTIRVGCRPTPVLVANAGVELACLHQVIPPTQRQEP